ncbi:DEP domain-containing protein 7-like [Solea senegalensis]|uniref:DEP domain-containing protein 7-like n=1 Tax=Solea senegalensis TaxID=28829 RepID=A0AAV6T210_SOLSE|nr:DEP domain-containing protein 7-like isoform X1 [Solea senegalensis]KAG7523393.1 DEP domain-containing protein 7-like [Solea senegalensis]
MASIKERAAALNLAEKLCVRPHGRGVVGKPAGAQSSSLWSGLISHLRSSVTVKRRRVHLKSHSDCFLGSEAVDVVTEHINNVKGFEGASVSRDKVVCVCQSLLDCNVFDAVGTNVFGRDKKQDVFQDSKSALYRFVSMRVPSVDELERGLLVNGIQKLFCSDRSDKRDEQTCPTRSHVPVMSPVKVTQTFLSVPVPASLSLETVVDGRSVSPSRGLTHPALPQSLVDEVWHEQTLLRLLNLVELPILEGLLQCTQSLLSPPHLLAHNNPDLIYSSNHLDRQILKAFRDTQEDEWLCAALDCLDFLSDQPVVELSRELPHCFPQEPQSCDAAGTAAKHGGHNSDELRLSPSGLVQCKVLLYRALIKHYSQTDKPPLLPQHMTDIYSAITDLLVKAKLDMALEALQLCLKLLPPSCRDELRRLLTFMSLAADPHGIKLDKDMENRLAVNKSFSRAIVLSKALSKEKEDLLVVFMLSNIKEIFKIPGALHKGVSDKLAGLVHGTQPDVTSPTSCRQVSSRTFTDSTEETTRQELWTLLNFIHVNTKTSAKERKRLLGQFYQAHPEIFNQFFGDSAASVL